MISKDKIVCSFLEATITQINPATSGKSSPANSGKYSPKIEPKEKSRPNEKIENHRIESLLRQKEQLSKRMESINQAIQRERSRTALDEGEAIERSQKEQEIRNDLRSFKPNEIMSIDVQDRETTVIFSSGLEMDRQNFRELAGITDPTAKLTVVNKSMALILRT